MAMKIIVVIIAALLCCYYGVTQGCQELFEGFGVHLGSMHHLRDSPNSTIEKVFDKTYSELGIRYYRTSYEPIFSPSRDVYQITCVTRPSSICSFIDIHHEIAKYPDISVMASIWSPPYYMKDSTLNTLLVEEEPNYYYYIKNITDLFKTQLNITVERVSPVNEPENLFASGDHCNMDPLQMCRMIHDFNDPLVSICPENAYFWVSEVYALPCLEPCQVFGTHAYALYIDEDDFSFSAYYDEAKYIRTVPGRKIWQTEVSSTFGGANETQMEEAIDMSMNIANLVGFTCIQRYYFWLAYTLYYSGESLIWGNDDGSLTFPKKYFAYKHFTLAAAGGTKQVTDCCYLPLPLLPKYTCLKFGESNATFSSAVFVNTFNFTVWHWRKIVPGTMCCTTKNNDWDCSVGNTKLPPLSICSCKL